MTDRILDRSAGHGNTSNTYGANGESSAGINSGRLAVAVESDESEIDDLGTFGFLRGSRERATMLELRRKNGNILALAYGYIDKAEVERSSRDLHPNCPLLRTLDRTPWKDLHQIDRHGLDNALNFNASPRSVSVAPLHDFQRASDRTPGLNLDW